MNVDIVCEICAYLSDQDKIHFLSVNKWFCLIKSKMLYTTPIDISHRTNLLSYYDNFVNIRLINQHCMCKIIIPKNARSVEIIGINYIVLPNQHHIDTLIINTYNNVNDLLQYMDLTAIKNLYVHRSVSTHIDLINECSNLETLNLSGFFNKLNNHWVNRIKFGPKLKSLTMGDQFDEKIVRLFDRCENLEIISLGLNFDQCMYSSFYNNLKLSKIYLSSNYIEAHSLSISWFIKPHIDIIKIE